MQIPKQLKIGRKLYSVQVRHNNLTPHHGWVEYSTAQIVVNADSGVPVKRRPPKQQAHTFWHEVTHAILHDMGHSLCYDERFVDGFAKRLNNAIYSAKF